MFSFRFRKVIASGGSAVLLLGAIACGGEKAAPNPQDAAAVPTLPAGEHMLAVPGGQIWYKVSGSGGGTPVIMLHGGPGFNSFYLKPLEALSSDRVVVRYDQLGSGKSGTTTDTAIFNIPHFVAELDSLRSALGYEKVHILGHSWGTMLGLEYYRAHPEHVASLTLSSAALDIPAWEKHAKDLVKTLPDSMQKQIAAAEKSGKFEDSTYQAALGYFYSQYVWRHPIEADLDSTMKTANQAIYNYMQGPSEFTITGTLKQYDATGWLKDVKVPVLYTVGEFDEANPATIKRFADMTPGAKYAVLKGAAHITPWDAPEENVRVVREFLRGVDSAAVKKP